MRNNVYVCCAWVEQTLDRKNKFKIGNGLVHHNKLNLCERVFKFLRSTPPWPPPLRWLEMRSDTSGNGFPMVLIERLNNELNVGKCVIIQDGAGD